ncbi:MAG: hypothetical protein ACI9DC_001498 [Gammaproteobacteria bacterium]|jgi:hypothetical protein
MTKKIWLILVAACLGAGLGSPGVAYAYLDPGSGSILLQGLLAGIAGAVVVGRLYWQRLKVFFALEKQTHKDDSEDDQTGDSDNSDWKDS